MKIGILGGSFDPIHKGHMHMAEASLAAFSLDEVWMIPAGHSPNKDESRMRSAETRMEMCRLACRGHEHIIACDYEVTKEGTSYTYLTMSDFKERYPEHEFFYILGGDSLDYFDQWRHPEIIASCATILAVVRDGFDPVQMQGRIDYLKSLFPCDVRLVPCERFDISSTEIRSNIADPQFCLEMLDPAVYDYINEHKLYR